MPYRRSRLQDYYEQLLGGKPSNGGTDQDTEQAPSLDSAGQGNAGSSQNEVSPDTNWPWYYSHLSPTPSTEQTTEQGSNSDSGGQDGTGSSQAEDSTDADQAKDENGAQDALLDFEDGQEDYFIAGLVAGLGPDRLRAFSNLEFLRVKQDIETRPLIFRHCFQHSASQQDALECIYAFPPDFDEDELRYLEQIAGDQSDIRAGMGDGGTGDAQNDVKETFTLDDVRQFTEIDFATETFDGDDAARYQKMLEDVFGYVIDFNDKDYGYSPKEKISQMQNLAKANVHIVDYLDDAFVNVAKTSGLSIFQERFSQTGQGKLRVHLGDDHKLKDKTYGFVPFWGSNIDKVYLGSAVNIATIVHEFGHVLDRNVDMVTYLTTEGAPGEEARLMEGAGLYRIGLGELILELVIEGFAAKQRDDKEVWADLFMTAVLHGKGETVYSLVETSLRGVWETGKEVICGQEGVVCDWRPVGWRVSSRGDLTENAKAVRGKLLELLSQKL